MDKICLVNLYKKSYLLHLNSYKGKLHMYLLTFDKVSKIT